MKTSKQLKEERGALEDRNLELINTYKKEDATEEQLTALDASIDEVRSFDDLITQAEKREEAEMKALERKSSLAAGTGVQGINKDEADAVKRFDIVPAIKEIMAGKQLTGAAGNLSQEAELEFRGIGAKVQIGIPSWAVSMQKRTDIDQATSAIGGTGVGAFAEKMREGALYPKLGGRIITGLTQDLKIPITGKQTTGWLAAENTAAADGGTNATSVTLSATRLSSYADISNLMLLQNGNAVTTSVMSDFGRSQAQLINTAQFATADVSNAPGAFAALTGVGTFTENAVYAATSSIFSDLREAEQTLANAQGLEGPVSYVLNTKMITDLKNTAQVASVSGAMAGDRLLQMANGYPVYFTVACTSNGTTSADGLIGNWAHCVMGEFGGLNITVNPWAVDINDQIRLVVHKYVDWNCTDTTALVKFTTLLA